MSESVTIDGNEAVARVAYALSEVIAIYPITPASPMGEWSDQWSSEQRQNLWGTVPSVVEMQSEGGAAGAIHGALQAGSLTTTFTASQGLLLMIPNMYKIAGELTPAVIHVAARSLAAQALSIFCDHSDVMAARATGFAMLFGDSVQEGMDMAAIAHAATLESRIPFLNIIDGFRTSHEVAKIDPVDESILAALIDRGYTDQHRGRALTPDHPSVRGTAQNPDVYFQARESVNPFYRACPEIVVDCMRRFGEATGRCYDLFEYTGHDKPERVIVLMGSGCQTAEETVSGLVADGERVGLVKVRLYRPFSVARFVEALPPSVRGIAVLDRTKEPGSAGEPLYLDVVAAIAEHADRFDQVPRVVGGRYGLSSKEFTPPMVKAALDNCAAPAPKNHFTLGIRDDVTQTSLEYDESPVAEPPDVFGALFYGLGSDGTVGANKNSIKIIGEHSDRHVQGYFVYDSKKSGSVTVSHLRFSPQPIKSAYLIQQANFVACHHFPLLERMDVLSAAAPGATVLLNCPCEPDDAWDRLPRHVQEAMLEKKVRLFAINGYRVAEEAGLGRRINTVMQTCFFAITDILATDDAIDAIKHAIEKSYGKRGKPILERNFAAVDSALAHLHEVPLQGKSVTQTAERMRLIPEYAPEFVQGFTQTLLEGRGDSLPVSAMPVDGTYPTATAVWEKRNIAAEIPVWDSEICIQCGKCVLVCPHGVIRSTVVTDSALESAPSTLKFAPARWRDFGGEQFLLQVAPSDCTGCSLCVEVCPVKNKRETRLKAINMAPQPPLLEAETANWDFFLELAPKSRDALHHNHVRDLQLMEPLFEFSGACAGCGETPYLKLVSQLFGDRMVVANATGCSSIYGGNLPTTPWTTNAEGRGPAWSNSLFEDNAEFGLGMRIALDKQHEFARERVAQLAGPIGHALADAILDANQETEQEIDVMRACVTELKRKLAPLEQPEARDLLAVADALVKKDVWIVGGDGWAYDIGFGGLDHVLASGHNVNVLVLDTEVYSNTGGQMSKSTPRAAIAKFASGGKAMPKKDLAQIIMTYGHVYVAQVAMGADDTQTLRAIREARAYNGPSMVIAYSHCIAHGYDLRHGLDQQRAAVHSGYWPLFRYIPPEGDAMHGTLHLDSKKPDMPLKDYMYREGRYGMLAQSDPGRAKKLLALAQHDVDVRWQRYQELAGMLSDSDAPDHGGK